MATTISARHKTHMCRIMPHQKVVSRLTQMQCLPFSPLNPVSGMERGGGDAYQQSHTNPRPVKLHSYTRQKRLTVPKVQVNTGQKGSTKITLSYPPARH